MNTAIVYALLIALGSVSNVYSFDFTLATQCSCPFVINPVCGVSRGETSTFMNECTLRCAQKGNPDLDKFYDGVCCSKNECSPVVNPVCDTRGEMHQNYCLFEKEQCLTQRLEGYHLDVDMSAPNCSCMQHCTDSFEPVCDTLGRTHSNVCVFSNAKCMAKAIHLGRCCGDLCTSDRKRVPICDSFGATHEDLCSFLIARCEAGKLSDSAIPQFRSFGHCN
uniref:Kazal-like domain-containing protein n=1 Tax=Steinernema glaseri TaxID=37863 RepID=A0A1I7YNG3_9BILA